MEKEVRISGPGIVDKMEACGSWNIWRGMNLLMSVFFIMAAYVNLNDADWYLWVPVYAISSLLSLPLVIKPEWSYSKVWNNMVVIQLTLCLAYGVYQVVLLVEAISGKLENPLQHEEGREMGGLLIIIAWLLIGRFTQIGRWVARFKSGHQQLKDAAHTGRPATTTTKHNIERIRQILEKDASVVKKNFVYLKPIKMKNKYMMNALLIMTVTLTFVPLATWSLCFVGDWHKRLGHCTGMF